MKLAPGDLIDEKYRIVGLLGQGGMGSVYSADNVRIDRRVAIKVLHRISSRSDVARFEREARAVQLGSSHIVQVYDLGNLADGDPYMVMEYLSGESLGQRIMRQRRLEPRELLPIAEQLLEGLAVAHRVGIIHRDLKPDNVFLAQVAGSDQEVVKILDFGISKFVDARAQNEAPLTSNGMAVGTPHYMSPEQVQGSSELDTRTDLYSVGVILYQCLSGRLPFVTDDIVALLSQILLEAPEPLAAILPGCDSALSFIVERAMAKRADERHQSAHELREDLLAWRTRRVSVSAPTLLAAPVPRPRARVPLLRRSLVGGLLAAGSAVAAIGIVSLFLSSQGADERLSEAESEAGFAPQTPGDEAEPRQPQPAQGEVSNASAESGSPASASVANAPAIVVPVANPPAADASAADAPAAAATVQKLADGISLIVVPAPPELKPSDSAQPSPNGERPARSAALTHRPPRVPSTPARRARSTAAEPREDPLIRQLSR